MKNGLVLLMLSTGCTSLQVPTEDQGALEPFFSSDWKNGEYLAGKNTLLVSGLFDLDARTLDNLDSSTVSLALIADNNMRVTYQNKQKSLTREIKGQIQASQFKADKAKVGGIPPLFWTIISESVSFNKDSDGNLVVYYNHGGTIIVGIMPIFGTSSGTSKYTFTPISK